MNEPPGEAMLGATAEAEGVAEVAEMARVAGAATVPLEQEKEHKPPAKPSARALTIIVVLTTFLAALGGFLLNRASAASSNDGDLAQELSLQASAAETSAYQQAETDYAQYQSLQALEAQAGQEMLEATYAQPDASYWADMYATGSQQVSETQQDIPSDLHPYLQNGNPDPNFPFDFFSQRASGATYLQAKSDAYNDFSNKWGALVDSYTAILTMVAVALFLFGSAFVLYGRNRMIFAVLGGLLVATGVAWGGWLAAAREPGSPSDRAAQDYAQGVEAMDYATTPIGYQPAIHDFTQAIKLRPDYALAYVQRAAAEALRGSEAVGAGFVSATNISPYWARLAASDELKAYQLGADDANDVLNVGWGYYVLWLASGGKAPAPGIAGPFFREAARLDPTNPVAWLDLGGAELATGQYGAANEAFRAGVTRMLYACSASGTVATCRKPQPVTSYGLQRAWFAGAMEGLESLASTQEGQVSPTLREQISKMEGLLTLSMATGKVVEASSASSFAVHGLQGFLDPNYLELDVPVPAGVAWRRMARMPITVVWYQRADASSRWSGISETACWGDGQEQCGRYNPYLNKFQFITELLAADNECFTNVEYKAELWVGGHLAGSVELSPEDDFITTNLVPALAKSMNMGICVPSSWTRQADAPVTLDVYGTSRKVTGALSTSELWYASPDRKEGVYLFRLYPERGSASGAGEPLASLVRAGEAGAVSVLRSRGLPEDISPRTSEPYSIWGGGLSAMNATGYVSLSTSTEAFVGGAVVTFNDDSTTPAAEDSSASSTVTDDYAVAVVVLYAPLGSTFWSATHSLGIQIFSSFSMLGYG
ncbi:MAG TPA: hypothetical protein VME20_12675 [Acidimicrobiales bacterium]|nr:hypothetical protein [Acidimicrobiales bacterium]